MSDLQHKYRAIIIDDEPLAIEVLESHLAQVHNVQLLGSYTDPVEAIQELKKNSANLLLVDINMPVISGLELVRVLKKPPHVIITTAHREYALEGFELDVVDYLLKPISFPRFLEAINKLEKYKNDAEKIAEITSDGDPPASAIIFESNHSKYRVEPKNLVFIESIRNKLVLHFQDDRELSLIHTLKEAMETLKEFGFIQIHRSYIVNLSHVQAFSKTSVTMNSAAKELPISRSYRRQAVAALDEYFNR